MRYWVYINDKVIETPFEEGELSSIQGFNGNTLICKETPAEGETQEWVPAKNLIAAYRQPAPPPPPSPQVVSQFASKEDLTKDPKITVLSGSIFGSSSDNNEISISNQKSYKMADVTLTSIGNKTEEITSKEQNYLDNSEHIPDKFFSEPATEILSLEEVEELNADNSYSSVIGDEEEVLKTAIKTLISKKPVEEKEDTLQAIDIAKNKNIDLSDTKEEYFDGKMQAKLTPEPQKEEPVKAQNPLTKGEIKQESAPVPLEEKPLEAQPSTQEQPAQTVNQTPKEEPVNAQEPIQEPIIEQPINPEPVKETSTAQEEPKQIVEKEIALTEDPTLLEEEPPFEDVKESSAAVTKDILQEFAKEKEEEKKEEALEEKTLEEVFSTHPIEESLEEQEQKETRIVEGDFPPLQDDILEPTAEESKEKTPTTLEELTGKIPSPEQATAPQEVSPIQQETPNIVGQAEKQPQPQQEKDNFLNTFSSDIETVFLDQPTAFISDYIPPEETGRAKIIPQEKVDNGPTFIKTEILDVRSDKGQHQVALKNVRRVKPAAIKTVPMVEGQIEDFSKTQIIRDIDNAQEAMAKIEQKNTYLTIFKTIVLLCIIFCMLIGVMGIMAELGIIIPKGFSPIHAMFTKNKDKEETRKIVSLEELNLQDLRDAEQIRIQKVINALKEYKLPEGITLGQKIKLLHPNDFDQLQWEAAQVPNDLTYYAVSISLPPNPEGYSAVNYRFNYNTVTYKVDATNSEANNVIIQKIDIPSEMLEQTQEQPQEDLL